MRSTIPVLATGLAVFLAASCSGTIYVSPDGGPGDSGIPPDAGFPDDAGTDAGVDGGVDAGTLDGGGPDGGCAYAFCEDFEGYPAGPIATGAVLGPWVATLQGRLTDLAVDPSGGFGGSQALRVTIHYVNADGGSVRATLNQRTDGGPLVGSSTLFGRAEIFYATDGDAGLPLNVHSWIFNASGRIPDGGGTSMNLGGGGTRAQLNYQYPPSPRYPDGGVYRLPDGSVEFPTEDSVQGGTLTTGVWHCLQWEYAGPPSNQGNVWIDGTPVISVNNPTPVKNWLLSDAYSSMDFGFTHYQELPNGIDLYLDAFALDSHLIACP